MRYRGKGRGSADGRNGPHRFNGAAVRYRGKANLTNWYSCDLCCFNGAAVRYRGKAD